MLNKIAITAAAAGIAAMTGLGAMTTTASAAPGYQGYQHHHRSHRICKPVTHYVKWFDRHNHPHWRKVVNLRCTIRWY
jgi:hypothetical protein